MSGSEENNSACDLPVHKFNRQSIVVGVTHPQTCLVLTGLSLLQVWVDYKSDVISGEIRVDYCPYNYFLLDPYFMKKDFSDCTACWKRSFLPKRDVISLLPEFTDEILHIPINGKDGKFNFNPNSFVLMSNNRMTYDEFWYRDYRKQTMLIDPKMSKNNLQNN